MGIVEGQQTLRAEDVEIDCLARWDFEGKDEPDLFIGGLRKATEILRWYFGTVW